MLRVQLPVRFTGLGHVNMYVIEDSQGAAVIDPGLPGRGTWSAIKAGLSEIGIPIRRVHSIYVTHAHPDHFGGVQRLAKASGAKMLAHESYRMWWRRHRHDDLDDLISDEQAASELLARKGAHPWDDPDRAKGLRRFTSTMGARNAILGAMNSPLPDVRIADGDRIELGGRPWQAIYTPGHTGDHLCLYDPTERLMITGDHVLPTITPHVSGMGIGGDALGLYLESLGKVAALPATALPAHGDPFGDLVGRTEQIRDHHDVRIDQILDLADRPRTTQEFAQAMYPERLWGYLADSETYAHLVHLVARGDLQQVDTRGPVRFVLSSEVHTT